MRKKTIVRYLQVGLEKPEEEIIKKIEADGRQVTAILRALIQKYGQEQYPVEPEYVKVARERLEIKKRSVAEQEAWENLSPEDYAVNTLRMKVKGGYAWQCMPNGIPYGTPLSKIKDRTADEDGIRDHLAILDGTYRNPMSEWWNAAECAKKVIENWDELKAVKD